MTEDVHALLVRQQRQLDIWLVESNVKALAIADEVWRRLVAELENAPPLWNRQEPYAVFRTRYLLICAEKASRLFGDVCDKRVFQPLKQLGRDMRELTPFGGCVFDTGAFKGNELGQTLKNLLDENCEQTGSTFLAWMLTRIEPDETRLEEDDVAQKMAQEKQRFGRDLHKARALLMPEIIRLAWQVQCEAVQMYRLSLLRLNAAVL